MSIEQLVIIPVLFGLIGFVEPCSLGANILFLSQIAGREAAVRRAEAIAFALTRALFLGIIGFIAGLLGALLVGVSSAYAAILGVLYISLGLGVLALGRSPISLPDLTPLLDRFRGAVPLGVLFGLSAPTCAAPLLIVLAGQGTLAGGLGGFVSMGLFGLTLSSPLVFIASSERAGALLHSLRKRLQQAPVIAALALIVIGLVTVWSALRAGGAVTPQ